MSVEVSRGRTGLTYLSILAASQSNKLRNSNILGLWFRAIGNRDNDADVTHRLGKLKAGQ